MCPTHCSPVNYSMPGLPVHHQLLEFTQTHVHWVGDAFQPSHPLSPPSPPAFSLSQHQGQFFTSGDPQYWSFSFSISPSNEYLGLVSVRMDWLDLLAVQGTLRSLLQDYSSKASILRHWAFFIVQLSHPYMTTGKTIALTRRTFVGKVVSLFVNMLSRLVITFLPRSERLLISWLQHHLQGFLLALEIVVILVCLWEEMILGPFCSIILGLSTLLHIILEALLCLLKSWK